MVAIKRLNSVSRRIVKSNFNPLLQKLREQYQKGELSRNDYLVHIRRIRRDLREFKE